MISNNRICDITKWIYDIINSNLWYHKLVWFCEIIKSNSWYHQIIPDRIEIWIVARVSYYEIDSVISQNTMILWYHLFDLVISSIHFMIAWIWIRDITFIHFSEETYEALTCREWLNFFCNLCIQKLKSYVTDRYHVKLYNTSVSFPKEKQKSIFWSKWNLKTMLSWSKFVSRAHVLIFNHRL